MRSARVPISLLYHTEHRFTRPVRSALAHADKRVRAIELLTNPPPSLVQYLPEKLRPPHPAPSIQLIDLRTINPLPIGEITDAVRKTGRLVVVHEAGKSGGVGNNLAGEVGRRAFEYLEAPIGLVSGWE